MILSHKLFLMDLAKKLLYCGWFDFNSIGGKSVRCKIYAFNNLLSLLPTEFIGFFDCINRM